MRPSGSFAFSTFLIAVPLILAGCTADKIVGRYASADCVTATKQISEKCHNVIPTASVSVITIATPGGSSVAPSAGPLVPSAAAASPTPSMPATPSPASPTVAMGASPSGLSMPERALATYIKALADPKVAKVADALRKNIAAPIKADLPPVVDDRTIFHRTIVVSVEKDPMAFNPADRLEAVDVSIKPVNAVIQSWDAAATIYSAINAGMVQLTGTQSGMAGATIGTPMTAPVSANLTGSFTASESRVEAFSASQQAELLTVSLANNDSFRLNRAVSPNELRVHRQGGIGIDLTGNVVVKVDIVLPADPGDSPAPIKISRRWVYSVKGNYFKKDGNPTDPKSLSVVPQLVLIAKNADPEKPPTPVLADVDMTYTLRHVEAGDETLEEKDDKVTEYTTPAQSKRVVLIPGAEASPRGYSIIRPDKVPLMIQRPEAGGPEVMCFSSYDAANDLVNYLQRVRATSPARLGTARLGFSTLDPTILRPLARGDVPNLLAYGACPA
jgi:hypothetical protein